GMASPGSRTPPGGSQRLLSARWISSARPRSSVMTAVTLTEWRVSGLAIVITSEVGPVRAKEGSQGPAPRRGFGANLASCSTGGQPRMRIYGAVGEKFGDWAMTSKRFAEKLLNASCTEQCQCESRADVTELSAPSVLTTLAASGQPPPRA